MPFESCAGGCGRKISISLVEGGNPEALGDTEQFSVEFSVCSLCRSYFCDRCGPDVCSLCGGEMAPGDSVAEAELRLEAAGGKIEDYLEQGSSEAFEEQVEELQNQIVGLDVEQLDKVAEPAVIENMAERTVHLSPALLEQAHLAGSQATVEEVRGVIHEQLARAFMTGAVIGLVGNYAPMDLDSKVVEPWYNLDLHLNQETQEIKEQTGQDVYGGVFEAVMKKLPSLDRALIVAAQKSLVGLGLGEDQLTEELAQLLMSINSSGLRLACAQAMSTMEVLAHNQPEIEVDEFLFTQLLQSAWHMDDQYSQIFPPGRMIGLFQALIDEKGGPVSSWAMASINKLALTFQVQDLLRPFSDLDRAKIFLSVGMMEDSYAMFEKSAQAREPEAQYATGIMSELGIGCQESRENYEHWMKTAADLGYPAALGECYGDGIGLAQDPKKYLELLTESAEAGDTFAMGSLGGYWMKQEPPDVEKAREWLTRAAEGGNAMAAGVLEGIEEVRE